MSVVIKTALTQGNQFEIKEACVASQVVFEPLRDLRGKFTILYFAIDTVQAGGVFSGQDHLESP